MSIYEAVLTEKLAKFPNLLLLVSTNFTHKSLEITTELFKINQWLWSNFNVQVNQRSCLLLISFESKKKVCSSFEQWLNNIKWFNQFNLCSSLF